MVVDQIISFISDNWLIVGLTFLLLAFTIFVILNLFEKPNVKRKTAAEILQDAEAFEREYEAKYLTIETSDDASGNKHKT